MMGTQQCCRSLGRATFCLGVLLAELSGLENGETQCSIMALLRLMTPGAHHCFGQGLLFGPACAFSKALTAPASLGGHICCGGLRQATQ